MARQFVASSSFATAASATPYQKTKTVTFTGAEIGDLLFVVGLNEGYYNGGTGDAMSTTSGTTSAWTAQANPSPVEDDPTFYGGWATASAAGSITVAVGLYAWDTAVGMQVVGWLVPAAEWDDATTPSFSTASSDSDANLSITIGQANSCILLAGQENTVDVSAATSDPTGATSHQQIASEPFALAWSDRASGADTFGFTGVSGASAHIVAMQYEGAAAGATATPATVAASVSTTEYTERNASVVMGGASKQGVWA